MKHIFLVEDDQETVQLLTSQFNSPQYRFSTCTDGKTALEKAQQENFDMIILDILLPDMDGIEVCRTLRENQVNSAIMMLTSQTNEADKILALELGADDYITKPVGIRELMAHTNALLRRTAQSQPIKIDKNREISFKDIYISKEKRMACVKGQRIDLTSKEFDLLYLMASQPGKTFSRQEMLEKVWGYAFQGYEHTVTSHINRLRLKIEDDLTMPKYILTTWGAGYRFSE